MIELGWSAPTQRVDAEAARRGILWQHQQIRTLLDKGHAVAELALDGAPASPDAVASAIGDLRSTMDMRAPDHRDHLDRSIVITRIGPS